MGERHRARGTHHRPGGAVQLKGALHLARQTSRAPGGRIRGQNRLEGRDQEVEVVNASEAAHARRASHQGRREPSLAPGARVLVDAWLGRSGDGAAAFALAGGDPFAAAVIGGKGMRALAEGRLEAALEWARSRPGSATKSLVAAEALITGGRVVAGLERLEALVRRRDPAGTLAFARRCHLLGDHGRSEAAASRLPRHPAAVLVGARAALSARRPAAALAHLYPFLCGETSTPDPVQAGAIGAVAATALARRGNRAELAAFARRLLAQGLVPPEMLPGLARIAWTAGLAAEAWDRLEGEPVPWREAARLELAILAGDREQAAAHAASAGALSEPCRGLLELLTGAKPRAGDGNAIFGTGIVEIWRTHPTRWNPWIEAVRRTGSAVRVPDLAKGALPPGEGAPDLVVDDGALVDLIDPAPVTAKPIEGGGIWVDPVLCEGVGIGHDWPDSEHRALVRGTHKARARDGALVRVLGAEAALAEAPEGRCDVVLAPPGDPFWAGPIPERAWPAMRVVRASPTTGWNGMGARIGALARKLADVRA